MIAKRVQGILMCIRAGRGIAPVTDAERAVRRQPQIVKRCVLSRWTMKRTRLLFPVCLLMFVLVSAASQVPIKASSDTPAAPDPTTNTVVYDTVAANVQSVSVGDAVQVFPPHTGFVEVTTVAYGPGEHPSCPNGRILFAAGPNIAATTLAGARINLPGGGSNGFLNLIPLLNETYPPQVGYDSTLVKLKNGDLILGDPGGTWQDNVYPHPNWWNWTVTYPIAGRAIAGGRVTLFVFRSSDCGNTWTHISYVDSAKLTVGGTPGLCAIPRLHDDGTKKWADFGGWDGPFLYADPYSGNLYWSSPCYYGSATGTVDQSFMKGIIVVSRDRGSNWSLLAEKQDLYAWRVPLSSARYGASSKIGFLFGEAATPNNLKLRVFDPSATWVDLSLASTIGTYTYPPSYPSGIKSDNTIIALYGGLAGDNMNPPRFYASIPNWTNTNDFTFSLFHADAAGGGGRPIDFTAQPANTGGAIWQADFVEPPPNETTSVFYWTDIKPTNPNIYEVRFQVLKNGEPLLVGPGRLTLQNGQPYTYQYVDNFFIGDYMSGASYRDGANMKFVVPWSQDGSLHFNTVTVGPPNGRPWIGNWHFDALAQEMSEMNGQAYVMQDVNGIVLPGGESRFNAIWTKSTEDRNAIAAWAEADFVTLAQQRHSQGYELIALNGFVLPVDQVRYNAIWTKTNQAHPYAYNKTRTEFGQLMLAYRNLGFELANLSAMVLSGDQVRYNAVWAPTNQVRRAVWDWLFQDLNQQDITNRSQGYRMIDVSTMVRSNNTPYYNAIWAQSTQNRSAVWSWAPKDFSTLNTQLLRQSYRIVRLNSFVLNGPGVLYNAIWEPDIHLLLPLVSK